MLGQEQHRRDLERQKRQEEELKQELQQQLLQQQLGASLFFMLSDMLVTAAEAPAIGKLKQRRPPERRSAKQRRPQRLSAWLRRPLPKRQPRRRSGGEPRSVRSASAVSASAVSASARSGRASQCPGGAGACMSLAVVRRLRKE